MTDVHDFDALTAADSERYQAKELKQHILDLPDTYIGSRESTEVEGIYIAENVSDSDTFEVDMVCKTVKIPMGLYKIFDEVLTNASDNAERTRQIVSKDSSVQITKKINVSISDTGVITVYNDGDGLPVVEHAEYGKLIAEMIFGQLLTSGNYNPNEEKTVGGRNGYGAKLCNIFSLMFEVETVDHRRKKKFIQTWKNHMEDPESPAKVTSFSGKAYTKITFLPDYAYFGMSGPSPDFINLIRKRTIDIAGWTPLDVSVSFNSVKIPVKSFEQYVNLYIGGASDTKRAYESDGARWEVVACVSPDGMPRQVSFVNGVCTINGGKHVEYIANQIARKLCDLVNNKGAKKTKDKKKDTGIKSQHVKNNLWVFVKSSIINPAFASQTKEVLITPSSKFGSKYNVSDTFIKKLEKTEIVSRAKLLKGFHDQAGLQKSDGKKVSRVKGIPKLEDANWAGTAKSEQCTLIITEGDSAKAFAVSGLKVVGSDKYGVYPIRGKLLNVRDLSDARISACAEIQSLKKIIGLQQGKEYKSRKDLRYGEVMILTDQDVDGSHIKGLLMNFISSFWECLMPMDFVVSFYTPIVKIRKKVGKKEQVVASFYNLSDYNNWKRNNPWVKNDNIKYYKGLGTSTAKEAREYFRNLQKITYKWSDASKLAIDLAFNKKRADSRKNWLRFYHEDNTLDMKSKDVTVEDFINRELIHFSQYDNQRSIPSFMDGLKPSQRKVLYGVLKRNQTKDIKVSELYGPIMSETSYHHGETSIQETMVGQAQDFVGSNNINLLVPSGQFGTRLMGGKDHSSVRYIYTRLEKITRSIFMKDDEPLLEHLNDDGKPIEPRWYLPIIPMILVNGSRGIGTGFSTHIPNFEPGAIIGALRLMMKGKTPPPLTPWYRGFTGKVERKGRKWYTHGKISIKNDTTVEITELPVGMWTDPYREYLDSLEYDSTEQNVAKKAKQCLVSHSKGVNHSETDVHLILKFKASVLSKLKENPKKLWDILKLSESSSSSVTNLHMFDPIGNMVKFKAVDGILRAFYHIRLAFYQKRRQYMLQRLQNEVEHLDEKIRFIMGIVNDIVQIYKKKDPDVLTEIRDKHKFKPNPLNREIRISPVSQAVYRKAIEAEIYAVDEESDINSSDYEENDPEDTGATADAEESSESESESESDDSEEETDDEKDPVRDERPVKQILNEDYSYLTSMQIRTLTEEKAQELQEQRDSKAAELEVLKKISSKRIWYNDLVALEKALVEHNAEWLDRRTDDK